MMEARKRLAIEKRCRMAWILIFLTNGRLRAAWFDWSAKMHLHSAPAYFDTSSDLDADLQKDP